MYYINQQGGARSESLSTKSVKRNWCISHRIQSSVVYLIGVHNTVGDSLSRHFHISHEWELNSDMFQEACFTWGHLQIDLFVTPSNVKCRRFCSRRGQSHNSRGDALVISWPCTLLHAVTFIAQGPRKLKQEDVLAILIALS